MLRIICLRAALITVAFALIASGCGSLIAEAPTIAPLATLTASPLATNTPAVNELSTPTPETPTPSPTVTLTSIFTSTPPIRPTSTFLFGGMTATDSGPANLPRPTIAYFVAFPTEAAPGEPVLLFWSSDGGTSASVTRMNDDGSRGRAWQVEVEGSLTVTLRGEERYEEYLLAVTNGLVTVEKTVVVTVKCLLNWFFQPAPQDKCPATEPVITAASAQEFERGRMFWLGDSNQIVVLFNDAPQSADSSRPAWLMVANPFVDGMPEDDPSLSPPPGLRQPRRGFGMVWRTTPGVADRLGWAVSDEIPFNLTYQRERGEDGRLYFADYLGQAILLELEGKGWQVIGTVAGP